MIRWGKTSFLVAVAGWLALAPAAPAQSVAEVVQAIDYARVSTRILYVTAHPDDERESVLTYLSRGLGDTVALCSTTRGEGGQNAIGPELGPALKVLRTDELYRATQEYGVQLFFTRAPDFGYSKSAQETLHIWNGIGKEDLTRVIRTFRPDIIINQWGGVHTGHGQHQATGIITPQAAEAAADSSAYPDQLREGLRTWQVGSILQYVGAGPDDPQNSIELPVNSISPLWGVTYTDLGLKGFANHRSQGITIALGSSFFRRPVYLRTVEGSKVTLDDLAKSLFQLSGASSDMSIALGAASASLMQARQAALRLDWPGAVRYIASAGKEVDKSLQMAQAESTPDPDQVWRLQQEKQKIDEALAAAAAVHFRADSDQSELVAGEDFSVRMNWEDRADTGIQFNPPTVEVPGGWTSAPEQSQTQNGAPASGASFHVSIPADAKPPVSPQDAILPWPAPLVVGKLTGTADGYTFTVTEPVISRDYTSTQVETLPLELVPAVTLSVDPEEVMLPENRTQKSFELMARVRYHGHGPAKVSVGIDLPDGWSAEPVAPLDFSGPSDRLARFVVTPPASAPEGAYDLKPYAQLGDQTFRTSHEALPSMPSLHVDQPTLATAHIMDLTLPEHLRVGYIGAGIDPVPQALEQIGIHLDMLDEAALAFGDLSQYSAIVVGIRAYELRPDLVSENQRLMDYVQHGGTLVVQYERDFAWKSDFAPFPASMDRPAERTTDENAAVRFVDPTSVLLNYPNRITQQDFHGWIQERGLYYWGKWDSQYHALLAMHDPGESDALGSLVYARDGKGVYIYTGLAFFRQLPAGVPGAYRLFVNLLSASQAPAK